MKYMHMISRERDHSEGRGLGSNAVQNFSKTASVLDWYRHPSLSRVMTTRAPRVLVRPFVALGGSFKDQWRHQNG